MILTRIIPCILAWIIFSNSVAIAQTAKPYLRDRGPGIATSMFATYIDKHEIIVYPFYEYYHDKNAEYKPSELGYDSEQDYRGLFKAHEGLIFLGYGFSDWFAAEFEAAVISAVQHKSPSDSSNMPTEIRESGLGDVEGQFRWRYCKETATRPELFSYFEYVLPLQKNKKLIGTQNWEFSLGLGAIRGYHWGTMTVRATVEYNGSDKSFDIGEYAIEYVRRFSESFRFYVGIEGSQDEIVLINDLQFFLNPRMFIRVNNSFGITSKAVDYGPEIGFLMYFNKK